MENDDYFDAVFHALADRRRRYLLAELAAGAKPVSALAAMMDLKMSAASKHVAVLESAGLLVKTRRGREVMCHLNVDAWREVAAYVALHAKFWAGRVAELEAYLNDAGVE